MQKTFNMMVIDHFGFIVSEYRFWIGKILDHDPDIMLEGFVEFQSPKTFVAVAGEWYGIEVSFGRVMDDRKFALSVDLVYEYLSLTPEQREIVCSPDPHHKHEARQLPASKQLQHEKRDFTDGADETEHELVEHARWIRQYVDPFLRGDFSLWLAIHEYRVAKMIGEVRRSGKREVSGRFVRLTEDRKAIYVQEHMFQSDVDYLARLKAEMQNKDWS